MITEKIKRLLENDIYKEKCVEFWNEYFKAADIMFNKFMELNIPAFIPQQLPAIDNIPIYGQYKEDLNNIYIEHIWAVSSNEIVVLFKTGALIRKNLYC